MYSTIRKEAVPCSPSRYPCIIIASYPLITQCSRLSRALITPDHHPSTYFCSVTAESDCQNAHLLFWSSGVISILEFPV